MATQTDTEIIKFAEEVRIYIIENINPCAHMLLTVELLRRKGFSDSEILSLKNTGYLPTYLSDRELNDANWWVDNFDTVIRDPENKQIIRYFEK